MSIKIESIDVKPGDHFFVKWCGSAENSIAISTWQEGHIQVSGPMNCNSRKFMFSQDGVAEITDEPTKHQVHHQLLHKHLDELIADMRKHKGEKPLGKMTVLELWVWSHEQILKPMEE
jgi:hypothetical protein